MAAISNDWLGPMSEEFKKPYYRKLYETVKHEYETREVYPAPDDIFNAFAFTPLKDVKVVILGQDPYHEPGQAHGLCFSVRPEVDTPPSLVNIYKELHEDCGCYIPNNGYLKKWADQGVLLLNTVLTVREVDTPPSLVNIYKELHEDCGCYIPNNGYLKKWADQGVLLLNTVLTVRAHAAHSHKDIGWESFTDAAIRVLNEQDRPMVFILWGKPAQMKKAMLNNPAHLILEAPHPSPLSAYRGFFGSRPFSRTNKFLWGKPAQMKKAMLNNPAHLILEAPHPSPLSAYRGFFGSRPFSRTNKFLTAHGLDPIDWQIENIGE